MAIVGGAPEVTKAGGPAEQYAALRQVATAVARGFDAEAVFTLVAERTARLVGADGSAVVRFDDGGTGRLVGHWARRGLIDREVPRDIDLSGQSSVAQVFQSGAACRVDDYAALNEPRGRFLARVYSGGVAVPVRFGNAVWGALAVGVRRPNTLGSDVEGILTDFAELVSLAVATTDPGSRLADDALLQTILSDAPVGIAFLDRDLRFARVNEAFAAWSGLSIEAHRGVLPSDDPARFPHVDMPAVLRVRAGGVGETDVVIERPDAVSGDVRNWSTNYHPVVAAHGERYGVAVVVTDVTDQLRDAELLRRERDSTAALIGAMHDGVVVWSPDGVLMDVSARFCDMTGFARDELVGLGAPYPFWGTRADATRAAEAFDRVRRGGGGDCELQFVRRDGRPLPVQITHAQMVDSSGEVSGYIATVRDVTDRVSAEEERAHLFAAERAARNRTEILQQVAAALSKALTPEHVLETIVSRTAPLVGAIGGSVLLDTDGTIAPVVRPDRRMRLVVSPRQFTVSPESIVTSVTRHGVPAFLCDRAAMAMADPALNAAVRADVKSVSIVQVAQQGRVLGALAFGFPDERSFDAEDRALLVTIGDVCAQALDRARLYDDARARADAFRQRDALRRAVLRGISHEFRSPLTAISNAADALARIADVELRKELLDVIGSETRRLDRFVANMLDLSRLEGGALEPHLDSCSVTELVAGALEAVDALVGDVAITVEIPIDIPFVRADPVLTERILLNLIHNASRHGGPSIELRVSHVEDRVWFVVVDDGPGVPSGMRKTIFEPFVGQREHGGLGVGLGLSRGLAVAQGGDLWLDDGRGGTRFVVALPVDLHEGA